VILNRVLRETVGPGRDKVIRKRRRLSNEELHDLCCSSNVITGDQMKEDDWACMNGKINGYKILARKPVGKRPLRRPRHRWVNNIKTCFKEMGCQGRAELTCFRIETISRLVDQGNEMSGSIKCWEFLD